MSVTFLVSPSATTTPDGAKAVAQKLVDMVADVTSVDAAIVPHGWSIMVVDKQHGTVHVITSPMREIASDPITSAGEAKTTDGPSIGPPMPPPPPPPPGA